MKTVLFVGGPLIVVVVAFSIWSGIISFGEEMDGLEFEQEAIEYREGTETTFVRKQPGLSKYTNITIRMPNGVDWKNWKFTFEREAALQKVRDEYDEKQPEMEAEAETEGEVEMIQIDPPVLVIPAQ